MKTAAITSFDLDSITGHNIAYGLPQVVFEINLSGRLVFVNRSAFDVFGYTEEDFVQGLNVFQMIIPEDVERAAEAISQRCRGEGESGIELTARRKDGSTFPVIINSKPVINKDGAPGLIGIIIDISKQKEIEKKLRESEDQLKNQVSYLNTLIENMNEVFLTYNRQGIITFVNKKSADNIGYRPEEMVGRSFLEFIHPDHREKVAAESRFRLTGGQPGSYQVAAVHQNGSTLLIELNSSLIIENGEVVGGMVLAEDITARKQAETALKEHEQRLKDIINFLPDPTLVINLEGQVIAWNRAMEEMTGVKADDMLGRSNYEYSIPFYEIRRPMLVDLVINPNQDIGNKYTYLNKENGALVAEGDCLVVHTSSGKRRAHIWAKATPLYDSQGKIVGAIETFRDITERREMENRLRYLNLHDSLTDLYNRAYFEEEMRRLDDGRRHPVGLMVCDLDGLKLVNDTLGHDAGDTLLVAAARVLKSCFRESDMVARIGGDEFAMLLPKSPLSTVESAYQRIRDAIASYNSSQTELHLSISVGYAVSDDSSTTMSNLYKEADNNMYREKLHSRRSARSTLVRTLMKEFLDKWEVGAG